MKKKRITKREAQSIHVLEQAGGDELTVTQAIQKIGLFDECDLEDFILESEKKWSGPHFMQSLMHAIYEECGTDLFFEMVSNSVSNIERKAADMGRVHNPNVDRM